MRKERNCNYSLLFIDAGYFLLLCLQDDLIKILGENHQLNEFLNTLYFKCSYLLFNKEHATAVLSEVIRYKSAENDQRIQSCMKILVVKTCHFGCIDLLHLVLGHLYDTFSAMILEQFKVEFIVKKEGGIKVYYALFCLFLLLTNWYIWA